MARAPEFTCAQHGRYRPPQHPKQPDCRECWAAYGQWRAYNDGQRKVRSVGRAKGGGQSSKKKGRAAVLAIRELLLQAAPWLEEGDIFVKATSQLGVDLHFSPRAAEWFKYAVEGKCVEALNIWAALKQAADNASEAHPPILFFKRAHTPMYVAVRAEEFLKLLPCPPQNPVPPTPTAPKR